MSMIFLFDLLCPPERYAAVTRLVAYGGGQYVVRPGTLSRHRDDRAGEMLAFDDGNGGGRVQLVQVVGCQFTD